MQSHQNIVRQLSLIEFFELGVDSPVDLKPQLDFFDELGIAPF